MRYKRSDVEHLLIPPEQRCRFTKPIDKIEKYGIILTKNSSIAKKKIIYCEVATKFGEPLYTVVFGEKASKFYKKSDDVMIHVDILPIRDDKVRDKIRKILHEKGCININFW